MDVKIILKIHLQEKHKKNRKEKNHTIYRGKDCKKKFSESMKSKQWR